jgi:hypothetical protein
LAGYGSDESVASAEEVRNRQTAARPAPKPAVSTDADYARLYQKAGELGLILAMKDGKPFPATLPVGWSTETRARAVEYVRGVVEQAEAATKAA